MLVTSIFSFSHNVFYSIKNRNNKFSNTISVISKCFEFHPAKKKCRLGKGLTTFHLFPASVFRFDKCTILWFGKAERINQNFLLFLQCFSKASYLAVTKTTGLFGKMINSKNMIFMKCQIGCKIVKPNLSLHQFSCQQLFAVIYLSFFFVVMRYYFAYPNFLHDKLWMISAVNYCKQGTSTFISLIIALFQQAFGKRCGKRRKCR